MNSLEVLCVHEKSCELVAIKLKSEEYAQAYVVNAALHSAIHRLGVVIVVVLRACGMKLLVALFIVCLLEKNVCADSRVVELFVVLDGGGGDVYVNAADCAVFMLD